MAKVEYKRREPSPIVTVYNKTAEPAGCPVSGELMIIDESNAMLGTIGKRDMPLRKANKMIEQEPEKFTLIREEAYAAMGMVDAQSERKISSLKGMTTKELIAVIKFQGYDGEVSELDNLPKSVISELAESWTRGLRKYPEVAEEVKAPKEVKPEKGVVEFASVK